MGTSSEITRDTITCAAIGRSGGGAERAHAVANTAQASVTDDRTDDRIIPTCNEYRRSAATASINRVGDRWTLALGAF